MASTELVQPDITAPRYPVDDITEREHCELMTKCMNLTLKVAVGSVLPPRPDGTFHCPPIPDGYAVVGVDEVMEGFEELELDHPTGEGETHLGDALRSTILWRKEHIVLPNWTPPSADSAGGAASSAASSSRVTALRLLLRRPPPRQRTPPPQLSPPPQRTPPARQRRLRRPPPRQRTPPPPPPQQRRKRAAAAPAASSTTGGEEIQIWSKPQGSSKVTIRED